MYPLAGGSAEGAREKEVPEQGREEQGRRCTLHRCRQYLPRGIWADLEDRDWVGACAFLRCLLSTSLPQMGAGTSKVSSDHDLWGGRKRDGCYLDRGCRDLGA